MDPKLSNLSNEGNLLTFRLDNINVSLANAIRRIILSEIPCVVFRTTPHKENKANITVNTSRFNNEIVKERLACIPIHITDSEFPIKDYVVEISKKNTSDSIEYVTTEDIKIRNIKNDSMLSDSEVKKIFPPNPITGDYIDIVRLRPALSKTLPGEELRLTCEFSVATAKENSSYNVASTSTYGAAKDPVQIKRIWNEKEKTYKKEGKNAEEIQSLREDWMLLDAKRIITPNAFNFIIESVGIFDSMTIVEKACQIMIDKVTTFAKDIQDKEGMIYMSETTMENSFDIKLEGEDYTLGKAIEYMIYALHYEGSGIVTYCGFTKPHPHIDISIIRMAFKDVVDQEQITNYLLDISQKLVHIYSNIKNDFMKEV